MARANTTPTNSTNPRQLKNMLINGNFDFAQRSIYNAVAYASNTLTFSADRWAHNWNIDGTGTGNNWNNQVVAFPTGQSEVPGNPTNFLRFNLLALGSGFGVNSFINIARQSVEDIRSVAGKTLTFSFWARSTIANQKLTIGFAQVFGSGGSPTSLLTGKQITLSSTFQKFTVSIAVPSLSGKTVGSNSYFELLMYSHLGSTFAATWGQPAHTLASTSGTIDVAQCMLNEGDFAAPFTWFGANIEEELAACQRYFEKSYNIDVAPGSATAQGAWILQKGGNSQGQYKSERFHVTKRVVPTMIWYSTNGGGVQNRVRNSNTATDLVVNTTSDNGTSGPGTPITAVDVPAGNVIYAQYTADAEL